MVLPFQNITRNTADDWLSAAFSESLTFGLQTLDDLILVNPARVAEIYSQQSIARSSALQADTVQRMSQLLQVRYYVHGSFQRVGDDVADICDP